MPVKLAIGTCFNIIVYFLAGLRADAPTFFIFYLASTLVRFTMSSIFRTIGSMTKLYYQALVVAGVVLLASLNYTGFTLPRSYMHPWFEWIVWINPLSYAFEVMMVNQVNGVKYSCTRYGTFHKRVNHLTIKGWFPIIPTWAERALYAQYPEQHLVKPWSSVMLMC